MNYLITGGCGFIGRALVRRLVGQNHRVRIVDNLSVGTAAAVAAPAEIVECHPGQLSAEWRRLELVVADIRDAEVANQVALGADTIVHLAANTGVAPSIEAPREDCNANIIGTLNYLEAARLRGVRRFVFASSGATLGNKPPPWHEDLPPRPVSPYGASKLAGEAYCAAYWGSFGIETVALRFTNVYGPGSDHKTSVVAKFLRRALAGQPLEIYGDGSQARDFLFIDDLVEAIEKAVLTPDIGGEVFQIGTSEGAVICDLAQMIVAEVRDRTGRTVEIVNAKPRVGEVHVGIADISKARRRLGYSPRYRLQAGLQATLNYFLLMQPVGSAQSTH